MICKQCGAAIVIANSKFCNECGAKVEPLKSTPPKRESFTGVRRIVAGIGTDFKIMPSDTNETVIIVDGPEEIKQGLTIKLNNGILDIQGPKNSISVISMSSINGRFVSISGSIGGDSSVSVSIITPRGVSVSIDTSGGVNCEIGDVRSDIDVKTSGGLTFVAGSVTGLNVNASGSVKATISHFATGRCDLGISGSCTLDVLSGHIEELNVNVSGSCTLEINSKTSKAILRISGSLRGNLRADTVLKGVSGRDRLNVIQ